MPDISESATADTTAFTRHLCASVYADRRLRRRVYELLFQRRPQALVPAPFLDMQAIATHCLQAMGRHRRWVASTFGLVCAVIIGVVWTLRDVYLQLTSASDMASVTVPLSAWLSVTIYLALVAGLTWKRHQDFYGDQVQRLREGNLDIPAPVHVNAEEAAEIERLKDFQTRGNLVVFSGPMPFVDGGINLRSWSIATELRPKSHTSSDGGRDSPVNSSQENKHQTPHIGSRADFHERITEAVENLGLPGLEVSELYYVPGRRVHELPGLLHTDGVLDAPRWTVDDIEQDGYGLSGAVRRFLCVHVPLRDGLVVVSAHLRVSSVGNSLYVECYFSVLPALAADKLWLSRHPLIRPRADIVADAIRFLGLALPAGVWVALQTAVEEATWWSRREWPSEVRDRIARVRDYDYGGSQSLRMLGTSLDVNDLFELTDIEAAIKLTENRLLESVRRCLDEYGFDTDEIAGRGATIVNNGNFFNVPQSGKENSFNVSALAMPANAQSQPGVGKGKEAK